MRDMRSARRGRLDDDTETEETDSLRKVKTKATRLKITVKRRLSRGRRKPPDAVLITR